MFLICLDFDLTITTRHLHNELANHFKRMDLGSPLDEPKAWEVVKNIEPTGSASAWKEAIEAFVDENHALAITTFSKYPELIRRYLKDKIGLNETVLNAIFIAADFPKLVNQTESMDLNPNDAEVTTHIGKSQHIARVVQYFKDRNVVIEAENIALIDDSYANVQLAKKNGHFLSLRVKAGNQLGAANNARALLIVKALVIEQKKIDDTVHNASSTTLRICL